MWSGVTRNTTAPLYPLMIDSVTPTMNTRANITTTTTVVAFHCTVLLPSGGYTLVLPNYYGLNGLVIFPASLLDLITLRPIPIPPFLSCPPSPSSSTLFSPFPPSLLIISSLPSPHFIRTFHLSLSPPPRDLPVQGVVTVFDSTDNGTITVGPTSGSVQGGTLLTIQGSGRFRQSSRYLCIFGLSQYGSIQSQTQPNVTSVAKYVSASEVVCNTPPVTLVPYSSTKSGAVTSNGNFYLSVDNVEFYPATFTYYSDNVQIQTVVPSVITSSGGLVQVVLNDTMVQSLSRPGLSFSCVVQGVVIPSLPIDATTTLPPIFSENSANITDNVYALICPIPPYDVSFGPLLLNNSVTSGVELSIGVTINGVDMFYSVTPLTVIPTPVIASLAPPIAMIRNGDSSGALGSASNPLVTISGVGFTNTTDLACMVGNGVGDSGTNTTSSTITSARYINTTTVQCNLHYTMPGPQIVQFSVNRVHWIPVGIFEYIAAPTLLSIVPASGPDHGSTVVRIQMAGMASGVGVIADGSSGSISCEFLLQGVILQLVPAWIDDNNDVLCTTNAMPPGVIQVYINYYGQRSDAYVNFTSYPTGTISSNQYDTIPYFRQSHHLKYLLLFSFYSFSSLPHVPPRVFGCFISYQCTGRKNNHY